MNINDIFEHTYVISLPHRVDRQLSVEKELSKLPIKYTFFDAVNGHELNYSGVLKKGEEGVRQSHLKILELCEKNKYDSVFIFEDDVELAENAKEEIQRALSILPAEVDMLYLGASHHQKPSLFKENVYKITHSYTAHAVYVSSSIFSKAIHIINTYPQLPVDVCYAIMHQHINAYAIYPHLAWQKNMYSDIQNSFTDYSFLKEEFVRFEKGR